MTPGRILPAGLALAVLLQAGHAPAQSATAVAAPQAVLPVLSFPEPGVDDTTAYQGYQTRFYRDSKQNTVQIYLEPKGARVVLLWADAANESAGFTVRDGTGHAVRLSWGSDTGVVADSGSSRSIEWQLSAPASRVTLGWFVLGSMRVERDFQYQRRHLRPFGAPPFVVAEESLLVATVARLPGAERARHLQLLHAASVGELRSRLQPTLVASRPDTAWGVRITRPALDGRSRLTVELRVDPRETTGQVAGRTVSLRARTAGRVRFRVRVTTDEPGLTPLGRDQIFNPAFLEFLAAAHSPRLEREVKGVELLSSEEKLMAGLPNFATYFGRDMLMTALMMRPIWKAEMSEHVIASVLRKLGPGGDVSHEEALAGQAIRESASDYAGLIGGYSRAISRGNRSQADSLLGRARDVLAALRTTRENYHMLDDEFQLPVLVARYLTDSGVSADRKRTFLLDSANGGASRLALLLRELALVASESGPYVRDPVATNLISFVKRDATHWRSASWRDSDAGYANGRFAMDINAIWVPQALASMRTILATLPGLGISRQALDSAAPEIARSPLGEYARDSSSLGRAIDTWRGARRHFEVTIDPTDMRERIRGKLDWLPPDQARYWETVMIEQGEVGDSLRFLALALDSAARTIPVVNTDPAAELALVNFTAAIAGGTANPDTVLRQLEPFLRPYPIGLFVDSLGPLVANDAYASRRVWETFGRDAYHSPRVVWGREVYLLLLGLANQIAPAFDGSGRLADPALAPYVRTLTDALHRTLAAVQASGLEHNELWSYRIRGGRLLPTRYGTSSDLQLWSTTDLAVQFVLGRLPRP